MCSIGIRRAERDRPQRVRVSVELTATPEAGVPRRGPPPRHQLREGRGGDPRRSPRSGHIDLCEGFAARIADACFADPRVGHVRVEVEKLDVFADAEAVGAILERVAAGAEAMPRPLLVGIVNITVNSFSDGGRFLDPAAAIAQARRLAAGGRRYRRAGRRGEQCRGRSGVAGRGDPPARPGDRGARRATARRSSVDTFQPETQRFAMARGVDYLNDIQGFPDPAIYPDLAAARCRLVVMHCGAGARPGAAARSRAGRGVAADRGVFRRADRRGSKRAGIARERLILDPGMGFFLSSRAGGIAARAWPASNELKRAFGLPVMVSVSRKSFLGGDNRPRRSGRARRGDAGGRTLRRAHGADLYPHARSRPHCATR